MAMYDRRLIALREELKRLHLDGFVVPLADEHMSEYVGSYARRLAWLTGFQGSAGTVVVTADQAAIFVDGRYTLQVREQVDSRNWTFHSASQTLVPAWLKQHLSKGYRIGYDPWLHSVSSVRLMRSAVLEKGGQLVAVAENPIDAVWTDQPRPSEDKLSVHPEYLAGASAVDKRANIAAWLRSRNAGAVVLSALDSIAWTFNIRGSDIAHTPVALAYALIQSDGSADLFVAPEKLTDEVGSHLGGAVRLHPRDTFARYVATLTGKSIAVDPERVAAAIFEILERAGATIIEARDPVVLPKSIKNAAEISGHRAAQARDGAALSRFLHWLTIKAPKGELCELSCAERLQEFRQATGKLCDLSFDTISGFGPNGAVVHYGVTEKTNRRITASSLYLVDSGGQYIDGTTDVTRTIAIGAPSAEMRDRFTRVLKGHIALAALVFPAGTRGVQIDALARQYLWAVGLDYAHGTGHGVGAYLGVHEGPQRIAHTGYCDEPLLPGMILSNEPGYYKSGEYGIRIENLMLVVKRDIPGAEREMLGFEILTFAPLDRLLIDVSILTDIERSWIDSYHSQVVSIVGPLLEPEDKLWLTHVTQSLG